MRKQPEGLGGMGAERPEPLGLGVSGIVERGLILHRQHHGMSAGSLQRGLLMSLPNAHRPDPVILQKTISALSFPQIGAGLGDRRRRLAGERCGHDLQASMMTPVRQLGMRKFMDRPIRWLGGRTLKRGRNNRRFLPMCCFTHKALRMRNRVLACKGNYSTLNYLQTENR